MLIINYCHYCEQWSKEFAGCQWDLGRIIYEPGGLAKTTQLLLRDKTLGNGELDALTLTLSVLIPFLISWLLHFR